MPCSQKFISRVFSLPVFPFLFLPSLPSQFPFAARRRPLKSAASGSGRALVRPPIAASGSVKFINIGSLFNCNNVIDRYVQVPGKHHERQSVAGRTYRQVRVSLLRSAGQPQRTHPVRVQEQGVSTGRTVGVHVRQRYVETSAAADVRVETSPTTLLPLSKPTFLPRTTSSGAAVSASIFFSQRLARITADNWSFAMLVLPHTAVLLFKFLSVLTSKSLFLATCHL